MAAQPELNIDLLDQSPAQPSASITNPNASMRRPQPGQPMGMKPAGMRPRPMPAKKKATKGAWMTFAAFLITLGWFGTVGFYIIKAGGLTSFLESTGAVAIIAVTGLMLAPASLFWMVFAYAKRAYDVESAAEPLLKQLSLITGQGGVAETRVRRFNEALREQLALLRETSDITNRSAEEALATLRLERDELSGAQASFTTDINILLNTIRGQTHQLEQLVHSGTTQLQMIAQRTQDIHETVNSQTDSSERRLTDLLAAIGGTLDEVGRMADERIGSLEEVTDRMAMREKSLRDEASISASTLEDAAQSIATAMTTFKQMATEGRAEADRLLATLNEHTYQIEASSGGMLERITNTKNMVVEMALLLSTTADKVTTSGNTINDDLTERVAALADAATALEVTSSKISQQIGATTLHFNDQQGQVKTLYDAIIAKMSDESKILTTAAETLAEKAEIAKLRIMQSASDLQESVAVATTTMGAQADKTRAQVETTIGDLERVTGESFGRYEAISAKAEGQAVAVAQNFNSAITTYESAAKRLNSAAAELQGLANQCGETLTYLDEQMTKQVGSLEQVSERVGNTSHMVKDDAAQLVNTLQQMIDRLETVRSGVTATTDTALVRLTDVATATGRHFSALESVATGAMTKLEQAGALAGEQTGKFEMLTQIAGGALSHVLSELKDSGEHINWLLDGFTEKTKGIGPLLEVEAKKAADLAIATVETMGTQAAWFGQKLANENTRWASYVEDQSKAFAETFQELQAQMTLMQQLHADIARSTDGATGKITAYSGAMAELEERIVQNGKAQQEQLWALKADFEKMLNFLQLQASNISTITMEATSGVRQATESFGEEAQKLNNAAKLNDGSLSALSAKLEETQLLTTRILNALGEMQGIHSTSNKAFAELEKQMIAVNDAHSALAHTSGTSAERLIQHNTTLLDLQTKITKNTETQVDELQGLRGGLETVLGYLQTQAAQLGDVAQKAFADVRGVSESFGVEALAITEAAKSSEYVLSAITSKLATSSSSAETLFAGLGSLRAEIEKMANTLEDHFVRIRDEGERTIDANETVLGAARDTVLQLQDMTSTLVMAAEQTTAARAVATAEVDAATVRFVAAGEGLGERAKTAAAMLIDATQQLGSKADGIYNQLVRAADQVKATEATLGQLEQQASHMRAQLVDEGETMIATLDRVTNDLTSRLYTMRATGESNMKNAEVEARGFSSLIEKVTADLTTGITLLKQVSGEAQGALEGFSGALGDEIEAMNAAQAQLTQLAEGTVTGEAQLRVVADNLLHTAGKTQSELLNLGASLGLHHDNLAAKQAEALSAISQTLSMLDQASNRLVGAGSDAAEIATAVEARFANLVGDADKKVEEKAQALSLIASTAEQAVQNYAIIASSSVESLGAHHNQISQMISSLKADVASTEENLSSLANKVTAASVTSGSATQQAVARMTDAITTMLGEFANVSTMAETTTRGLITQSDALRAETSAIARAATESAGTTAGALDSFRDQAVATQAEIADQVQQTLATLAKAEADYKTTAQSLTQSEMMARSALSALTHSFTDILQTANRSLDQLKAEFETTALAASGTLNQSQDAMAEKSAAFASMTEKLAGLVEMLGMKTGTALSNLQELTTALETTHQKAGQFTDQTAMRLHDMASVLETRQQSLGLTAEEAAAKLAYAGDSVMRDITGLLDVSLKTETQAKITASNIQQLTQDAASTVAQFERDAGRMTDAATRTATAAEKAAQVMQMTSDAASTALDATTTKLQATANTVVDTLENESGRFKAAVDVAEDQLQRIANTAAAKAHDFLAISQTLGAEGQKLEAQVTQFAGNALAAVERLQAATNAAGGIANSAVARLTDASETVGERIVWLDDRAKAAGITLDNTSRQVLTQATALQQHAQSAEAQVQAVRHAIDELKQNAAVLKNDVSRETDALTLALATAVKELESAGDALYRQSQQTQNAVMQMGQTLQVSTRDLSDVTNQYQREQEQVRINAQTVLADTARVLGEFYGFRTSMTNEVSTLTEQMNSVAATAEDRMRKLNGQLGSIMQEIAEADELLNGKLASLGGDHTKLRQEIERSLQLMATASNRLREVSSDAYSEVEELTDRMAALRTMTQSEVTGHVSNLRTMVESASELLHELGTQLETQAGTAEAAHTDLVRRAGSVGDQTRTALEQLQALTNKLEKAKLSVGNAAEDAAGRLAAILAQVQGDEDADNDASKAG